MNIILVNCMELQKLVNKVSFFFFFLFLLFLKKNSFKKKKNEIKIQRNLSTKLNYLNYIKLNNFFEQKQKETGGGEGIEIVKNEPYENEKGKG